ncbi:hypothetical protein PS634_02653 [Pseudomonas fluorescens]|nr:hypothetical protein PS634_02653 [Pseudomonas fluorescens]
MQFEVIGRYKPTQVGQKPVYAKDQRLVAQYRTFGIVQRSGRQRETIRTGNLAAPVTHHIQVFQQQLTGCVDQSILVVQHTVIQIQADITVAIKTTIIGLIKPGDRRCQSHGAGDAARLGVVDLSGSQPKGAGAGQTAVLVVVECARGDGHAVRCNATALTVVQRTAGQRQAGVTEHLSALVDDGCSGGNRGRSGAGDAATAAGKARRAQVQGAVTAQHALIVIHGSGGSHAQVVSGVNAAFASVGQLPQRQLNVLLAGH